VKIQFAHQTSGKYQVNTGKMWSSNAVKFLHHKIRN